MTKRVIASMLSTLAFAATTTVAQSVPAEPQAKPATDITVTGCLIQGSGPAVFVLDRARMNADNPNEKSAKYRVVAKGEDMGLPTHLNHQVALTGATVMKTIDSQTGTEEERGLPTFEAKSMVMIADRCAAVK